MSWRCPDHPDLTPYETDPYQPYYRARCSHYKITGGPTKVRFRRGYIDKPYHIDKCGNFYWEASA